MLHITATAIFSSIWTGYIIYMVHNTFPYITEESMSSSLTVKGSQTFRSLWPSKRFQLLVSSISLHPQKLSTVHCAVKSIKIVKHSRYSEHSVYIKGIFLSSVSAGSLPNNFLPILLSVFFVLCQLVFILQYNNQQLLLYTDTAVCTLSNCIGHIF